MLFALWCVSEAPHLRRVSISPMPISDTPETDEDCTCKTPSELRLNGLLIHGIVVRCESCGGIYQRIEDPEVVEPLLHELSIPREVEARLTLDDSLMENVSRR